MSNIESMEHLRMPWKPEYNDSDESWNIVTDTDGEPWYVASITLHLPDDESGERTCRAICEAHNSALSSNNMLTVSGGRKETHE